METELLERLYDAALAYFRLTDEVESMHVVDVVAFLLEAGPKGVEKQIKFYNEEVAAYESE